MATGKSFGSSNAVDCSAARLAVGRVCNSTVQSVLAAGTVTMRVAGAKPNMRTETFQAPGVSASSYAPVSSVVVATVCAP